jgi:hypothetical protein
MRETDSVILGVENKGMYVDLDLFSVPNGPQIFLFLPLAPLNSNPIEDALATGCQ